VKLIRSLFRNPLDFLIVALPLALFLRFMPGWEYPTLLFFASAVAIIPLAGWMGRATEELSEKTGPALGGLLNASFGNATELIIALVALSKGLTDVVKASLTGSIIGNLLLVLGASILAGGFRFRKQVFNRAAAQSAGTSMALASIALIVPTVFHVSSRHEPGGWVPLMEQRLSVGIAIVLFITYVLHLIFSLGTHRGEINEPSTTSAPERESIAEIVAPEEISRPIWMPLAQLAGTTILLSILSEFLVGSLELARQHLGLTQTFVGVIVVAIVGNAAEHSTAIFCALKNKLDLSLNIAFGSSLQIALFVTPILVFASYFLGQPMNMEFSLAEVVAVGVSIFIAVQISSDGETNWLEGAQLLSLYVILAILFFFLPEASPQS
jgi:Ca2+:H+ antiporter